MQEAWNPAELPAIDRSFYAALKLHVYNTIHDSLLTTLLKGQSIKVDQAVKLEVGRFTARKAANMLVNEGGKTTPRASADFYGWTSHKVREKLSQFHELGVLDLVGKGLRDAFTYKWRLPIKHWEVCSFLKVRKVTRHDLSLNLELNRIYHTLGFEPFGSAAFQQAYERVHAEEYGGSRWGKRKFDQMRKSYAYQGFLKARLDQLVDQDLVLMEEKDHYSLNPALGDELNHFDMFVNEVAFHPSRSMCAACKLDGLCRAGSTQLLIVALNKETKTEAETGPSA